VFTDKEDFANRVKSREAGISSKPVPTAPVMADTQVLQRSDIVEVTKWSNETLDVGCSAYFTRAFGDSSSP